MLQMLGELNKLLDRPVGDADVREVMPTYTGHNGFLNQVIVPLYSILKAVGFGAPILEQFVVVLLPADAIGLYQRLCPQVHHEWQDVGCL